MGLHARGHPKALAVATLFGGLIGAVVVGWLLPRELVLINDAPEGVQSIVALLIYIADVAIVLGCCRATVRSKARRLGVEPSSAVRYMVGSLLGVGLVGGAATIVVARALHFRTDLNIVALEVAIVGCSLLAGTMLGAAAWAGRQVEQTPREAG